MNTVLTNEAIQKVAPSAFAGQAFERQSSRYAFLPTVAVIDGLRNNGYLPVSAEQSRTKIEGKKFFTKHRIQFEAANRLDTVVGDTTIRIVLINSHDGTSSYHLSMGAFRKTCMNGAHVSEGLIQSIRVRHTGNIVDQVLDSTEQMIEQAPRVTQVITEWKQIILTNGEAKLLAEQALSLRYDGQAPISPENLLRVRRPEDNQNDLWTVFNRIQEGATRGGDRYLQDVRDENNELQGHRRMKTRAVNGIDQNTKLNKALWTLTEKMAELKK